MNTTNPYAPPRAAVQDVDAPNNGELAGRGLRLGTVLLDGIIMAVMIYLPMAFSVLWSGQKPFLNGHFNFAALMGAWTVLPLLGLIAFIWLNVTFVSRNGQSIGKKITGIKVVRSDGSPASLGRIFWLRNAIGAVLGLIPVVGSAFGLVDCLLIFGQPRQCLHDKFADTIVIKA
ncbi:MAG: RDD family protein [Proteobacteria bacterium]|nr:RDD family protein [Pseudomonadota bacterium]